MIGALALAVLATQEPTPASEARAVLVVERPEVHLGEPFELRVDVDHGAGSVLRVGELPWRPEQGWLLFEAGEPVALDRADGRGLTTTVRFRVAAIEQAQVETEDGWAWSASRAVPAPELVLVDADGERPVACAPAELVALSVLAVGEDTPRPLPGLLAPPPAAPARQSWLRAAVVAAVSAAVLVWAWLVLLRQRGDGGARRPEATVDERRRAIDGVLRAGEASPALVFELTALVRDAVDARLAAPRRGLTDAEWLAALPRDADLASLGGRLGEFLARAARAKYAGDEPTQFAVEELAREALALVDAARAPRSDGAAPRTPLGGAA